MIKHIMGSLDYFHLFLLFQVVYFGSDKKRYQLEVTESKASRAGSMYSLEGARKGYKRFSTSETKVCQ